MQRRDFLGCSVAAGLASSLLGKTRADAAVAKRDVDRYGGWKGKRFKATGFFRVEKDDRWWLVTPDGNAFLSWGINHLYPDLWKQEYNREVWKKKLGMQQLNGPAFNAALRFWFLGIRDRLGFNTVGVHNALQILNQPRPALTYLQPVRFVDIPHWKKDIPDSNFVDVFSPEFTRHCDGLARKIALYVKDDPFLLGYSMTDCTMFTEEDLRERPDVIGEAAGSHASVGLGDCATWDLMLPARRLTSNACRNSIATRSATSTRPMARSGTHLMHWLPQKTGGRTRNCPMRTKLAITSCSCNAVFASTIR